MENFNDIIKVTDVFIQISAESIVTIKILVLLSNRDLIKKLLESFQFDCSHGKMKLYK